MPIAIKLSRPSCPHGWINSGPSARGVGVPIESTQLLAFCMSNLQCCVHTSIDRQIDEIPYKFIATLTMHVTRHTAMHALFPPS
jgi:hypothetical protein